MPKFSILIPTFDHGDTIRFPLQCLRDQTEQDYEVFIVGDGVPPESESRLRSYATEDSRVSFIPFPKHVSRGEPNRHQVLSKAKGQFICYLTDRDLWMPDHLERIGRLLESADFTHSLGLHILPEDRFRFFPVDLANSHDRHRMLTRFNRVPLSCAAHTLEMYRRLPSGWDTTPPGKPTDWHMFQKFLQEPTCRTSSGTFPSAITFPSPPRRGWSELERITELTRWKTRMESLDARRILVQEVLEAAVRSRDVEREELLADEVMLRNSGAWRIGDFVLRITGARFIRRLLN